MEDRFKFRVVIFERKEKGGEFVFLKYEYEPATYCINTEGKLWSFPFLTELSDRKNAKITQWLAYEAEFCTGLKDKNGKLIYELDYIKYQNNEYKVKIDKFFGITLTNILNGDIINMNDLILLNSEVISNEFECNTKI